MMSQRAVMTDAKHLNRFTFTSLLVSPLTVRMRC